MSQTPSRQRARKLRAGAGAGSGPCGRAGSPRRSPPCSVRALPGWRARRSQLSPLGRRQCDPQRGRPSRRMLPLALAARNGIPGQRPRGARRAILPALPPREGFRALDLRAATGRAQILLLRILVNRHEENRTIDGPVGMRAIGPEADQVTLMEHLAERVGRHLQRPLGDGDVLEDASRVGLSMAHCARIEEHRVDLDQGAARASQHVPDDEAIGLQAGVIDGDHRPVPLANDLNLGRRGVVVEEACVRHVERARKCPHGVDRWVALPALDERHGRLRDARLLGERGKRQTPHHPPAAKVAGDRSACWLHGKEF